jgi:1-acyl-sn-glycerol-3-phosphate acyltransferase
MQFIYTHGGVFPVRRGARDEETFITAETILARGGAITMYCEGGRSRTGKVAEQAKRGIGRLALETGAPVVPVAVIGSDAVRRGWRIRPRKVRLRVGPPLRFPTVESCSPALAAGVTERIWACVSLQWVWLGGATGASAEPAEETPRREISRAA